GVGGGGTDDAQADVGHAVAAQVGTPLLGAQFDPGHVAQAHHVAVGALADRQPRELLRGTVAAFHAQGEIARGRFDAAGGQLDVLRAQRRFDVARGDAARGHGVAVQPDAHGIALGAAQLHAGHAVQRGEPVDHVAVGVVGQLHRVHHGGTHVEPDDDVGVGLDLGDLRRVSLVRQAIHDPADAVAHVVGRRLDVAAEVELDGDVGAAVAALRLDGA